jgi:microcystin-dependent protein
MKIRSLSNLFRSEPSAAGASPKLFTRGPREACFVGWRHSSLVTAAVVALATFAAPAFAETVAIANASDWATFANRVNGGETTLNATMTANVTLGGSAPRAGDAASHPFQGTFDGAGHTLAVNWSFGSTKYAAPFSFVKGCTILNLRVAGSLQSSGQCAAGLIGYADTPGTTKIERCCVSAAIASTHSGSAYAGGFLGETANSYDCKISFRDCLFDGSLLGASATACGGFAGNKYYNSYLWFYNCLFAPAELTVSPTDSYTFSRPDSSCAIDSGSSTYCYTRTLGTAQGTDASSMAAETLASRLGTNNWTVADGKVVPGIFAAAPGTPPEPAISGFTYHGAIKNVSGAPLTGAKKVEIRLYTVATGGSAGWGRSYDALLDGNGMFSIALCDDEGTALGDIESPSPLAAFLAANAAGTVYAGVTVAGSSGEIAPRQRILPVPYASWAFDTAGSSGAFDAAGTFSAQSLAVSGNASLASATVNGNASVKGNCAVAGTVSGKGTLPVGSIVLWSGSKDNIPDGWALCNGQTSNGRKTPDLRNRFVVGAGRGYSVGATGGADSVTLSLSELPSHTHELYGRSSGYTWLVHNDSHEVITYANKGWGSWSEKINDSTSAGGGGAHENRPPFYALCYIMRVK